MSQYRAVDIATYESCKPLMPILLPLRYETFLALEKTHTFSRDMQTVFNSVNAVSLYPTPHSSASSAAAAGAWSAQMTPYMLKISALREVVAHPDVVRYAARHGHDVALLSPEIRHAFLTRYAPHDMDDAKNYCGYYPEEFIEFLELNKKWGQRLIMLADPPARHFHCCYEHFDRFEYFPLQKVGGRWAFVLHGLAPTPRRGIDMLLHFAWAEEDKIGQIAQLSLLGSEGRMQWILNRSPVDANRFQIS
ncbi:hypothetical protein [Ketogulonicigenium vulgare]|uniref:hypothetical protein n=1 Tax=Ketogulonicigenium vulgare TaxID=92945 RepID=UPI0023588A3E|nr:hypothetical protein [Ketogulonicigenium vulgare]